MQAVLAGREAHIYGRSFFLPRKPTRGLGGKGSEYLLPQSLISSECPGLLWAANGHEGDKNPCPPSLEVEAVTQERWASGKGWGDGGGRGSLQRGPPEKGALEQT